MSRRHRTPPRERSTALPPRERPADQPSYAASVLALQRVAGNAAVTRLLRQDRHAGAATVAAPTSRQNFEAQLRDRWGIAAVRTGTEADQVREMRSMTPSADAAPTSIADWQQWDPGQGSDLYDDILAAFEDMGTALGGIPDVRELRFLAVDYENESGAATARPTHGATYGAGVLDVFHRLETATWPLPQGRSRSGAPAQVGFGSLAESRKRILVHELSHGVYERFGNPTLAGGSTQFFRDWEQAGGWSGGRIVQSGTPLTTTNWNDEWPEQPVSAYSLSNPMEDFAESLMCFIENRAVLRARSPARHQFIDSRLGAWRGPLRAPLSSGR